MNAADYINCMMVYNAPLPNGLTKDDALKLINAGSVNMAKLYSTEEVTLFMAGEFMEKLNNDMRSAVQGKQSAKLALYLGRVF